VWEQLERKSSDQAYNGYLLECKWYRTVICYSSNLQCRGQREEPPPFAPEVRTGTHRCRDQRTLETEFALSQTPASSK